MPPFRPRAVRLEHSVDLIQYDAQQHRQTRRESEEAAEEAATAIARLIVDQGWSVSKTPILSPVCAAKHLPRMVGKAGAALSAGVAAAEEEGKATKKTEASLRASVHCAGMTPQKATVEGKRECRHKTSEPADTRCEYGATTRAQQAFGSSPLSTHARPVDYYWDDGVMGVRRKKETQKHCQPSDTYRRSSSTGTATSTPITPITSITPITTTTGITGITGTGNGTSTGGKTYDDAPEPTPWRFPTYYYYLLVLFFCLGATLRSLFRVKQYELGETRRRARGRTAVVSLGAAAPYLCSGPPLLQGIRGLPVTPVQEYMYRSGERGGNAAGVQRLHPHATATVGKCDTKSGNGLVGGGRRGGRSAGQDAARIVA